MERGLTKNAVISELTRSPHGDLAQYLPIGMKAAAEDPNFFGHLIAWNQGKGQIRDAKVALPVIALTATGEDAELRDNALAHIVSLDPRNLVRAVRFAKGQKGVRQRLLYRTVERYLREREESPGRFERAALQHKASLKELYALLHIKPGAGAQTILFEGKKVGVFADVANLKNMAPDEIAGTIMRRKIPFLVAMGALGAKAKDPAVVQALIGAMSPTELVTNSKMLERLGVKNTPSLRAAYEVGLQKVAKSNVTTLKTTRAAEAIGGKTAEKLKGVQEKQLDSMAVQGDWLILADKSGSMQHAIETARHVSAILARVAQGKTHLVFFNSSPTYYDVTGKDYEQVLALTKREIAMGGTCIGCGLDYALQKRIEVDGIAVVSDGGENQPPAFREVHAAYTEKFGKDVPVYYYKLAGQSSDTFLPNCERNGLALQTFDLTRGVDFYSLPNLIQTMRTNRYGLVDEIMQVPLLRLEDVFKLAA
jgi:hypothetical protein